jgi:DNA-binding MarR family transcriptional regulator
MALLPGVEVPAEPSADGAVPGSGSRLADYEAAVAGYTAAGANETVQRVVTALTRISKRLDNYYREQFSELNLQRGDWGVLAELALHGADSSSTPSRLADVTGVSPSTMTHRLDQLVERGLVQRTPDPDNRTRMRVRLTRAGQELFRQSVVDADATEAAVLAALEPAEQAQLADLLEKVLASPAPRRRHYTGP